MINVWVLFVLTHGGMAPILETHDESTCQRYAAQYSKSFRQVECHYLSRQKLFRPNTYGKLK